MILISKQKMETILVNLPTSTVPHFSHNQTNYICYFIPVMSLFPNFASQSKTLTCPHNHWVENAVFVTMTVYSGIRKYLTLILYKVITGVAHVRLKGRGGI